MLRSEGRHLKLAPPPPRSCTDCVHAFVGMNGIWCLAFKDEIWTDKVAADCEVYEE